MKLTKATLDAIERRLSVYLAGGYYEVEIRAVTALYENGGNRSRLLYRGNLPKVLAVCREIFEQGGAVDLDSLPWSQINIWQLGWTPELTPLRDDLLQRWRTRPYRGAPIW